MSDSPTQKTHRPGPTASGRMPDGLNPASPRQVARLRFLGVSFHEPLSMGQAGTLIDRTNADPGFAARIEEWHARKFELHPALYPSAQAATVVPSRQDPGAEFRLPPRGSDEAGATIFQKRRLEQFGGCDFPVIDSLGRDQAAALINFLEAESVSRSREFLKAQAAARAQEAAPTLASRQAWEPVPGPAARQPARPRRGVWVLSVAVVAAGLVLFFLHRRTAAPPETASANATPSPVAAAGQTTAAARFQPAVASSQARALKKYPALGVGGSRFNAAFVARYQQLRQQGSPQLNSPDWPEKLADECAAKLPAAYY